MYHCINQIFELKLKPFFKFSKFIILFITFQQFPKLIYFNFTRFVLKNKKKLNITSSTSFISFSMSIVILNLLRRVSIRSFASIELSGSLVPPKAKNAWNVSSSSKFSASSCSGASLLLSLLVI